MAGWREAPLDEAAFAEAADDDSSGSWLHVSEVLALLRRGSARASGEDRGSASRKGAAFMLDAYARNQFERAAATLLSTVEARGRRE